MSQRRSTYGYLIAWTSDSHLDHPERFTEVGVHLAGVWAQTLSDAGLTSLISPSRKAIA